MVSTDVPTGELSGIHHVTAVSARIRDNYRFYTEVMGMRLVKRTVNQDDVSAYHLFYADAVGSPGTDLTFFDWDLPRERRGGRSVARAGLRVRDEATLAWWAERFSGEGVRFDQPHERDGRLVLEFEDPEGQRLMLVTDGGRGDEPVPWEGGPVSAEHQIRGLGPLVLSVPELGDTETLLTRVLSMERVRSYQGRGSVTGSRDVDVHVFQMTGEGPHAELHLAVEPDVPPARLGAGGVHHLALRTPDPQQYAEWHERLNTFRVPNSGPVDRYYFRSLYFRTPAGILFEIATDGPGFAVDEAEETLGQDLVLPPFLESRREEIEAGLRPID